MSKYNGWSNRETWLINVWFNPESRADVEAVKDQMDHDLKGLPPYMQDMLNVDNINWEELEDHCEETEDDE